MKNRILKLTLISILFIFAIGLKNMVFANSISSIDMDIYVDNDGNAEVAEVWRCNSTSQTEWYRSYFNLGNSEISNLRVSDEKQTYTTLTAWDVSGSFSEKAYKCGINKVSNGIEICWGKSEYGSNTYTIKYNITNFVSELTDSQMMYWTLIPSEHFADMGAIKIKIHADKPFSDSIPVWGYGKYGSLCYIDKNDGAIHMDTEGKKLGKSEYIAFLAKFPKETFNLKNKLNHDFNYYFEMAQKGAKAYNKVLEKIKSIIFGLLSLLPFILMVILGAFSAGNKKYGFKYGEAGRKIPKDVAYFRDIPCNGDIFRAYYIAYQYGIMKNKTDLLGAIILKWLKAGIIRTEQRNGGKIFKKEETVIILGDNPKRQFENKMETKLFNFMYVASKDGILENKEFEKWCKSSYEKILDWFDDILEEERDKLITDGFILVDNSRKFFGKRTATQELKNEALYIAGLKRFLLDYTLIKDRTAIEVELFENYLIYAQLLGIAKQVSKQFKELYPDMIEQTNYNSYDNIIYINHVSSSGISSANAARAAAESYSSGGGGFSSGGGGGGSFGGGGGIGSR